MSTPATLPADFNFDAKPQVPDTLPPDFDFKDATPTLKPAHAIDPNKLSTALISSHMTKMPVSLAYDHHDTVKVEFEKGGGQAPVPATIANDIKVGMEGSIPGLIKRNAMPEILDHPSKVDDFIKSLGQMIGDLPVYVATTAAGAAAGSEVPVGGNIVGGAIGFGIPAMMREALVQGISKGGVTSFGDLIDRVLSVAKEGGKGAVTGAALGVAGKATVPLAKALGPASGPAEATLKVAQQAAALEVVGNLLEGHLPTAAGFTKNAALVGALELVAHGVPLAAGRSSQALMDVYAKDGTPPEQTATKLQAQPPVKPDAPPGLQPAIKITASDGSPQVISGENETHSDVAERHTGTKPVTIDQLEADPKLADKVLERPETHVQQVIDRAYTMKADADPEFRQSKPQSGRGFTTDSGDYMSRSQAKSWVKQNEPDVYEAWEKVTGNPKAEFHSADYKEAKERAAAMHTAQGDPQLDGVSQELTSFLAKNREELNSIKASDKGDGYGNTVLRSTYAGPRNMVRAQSEQAASHIEKLLPDYVDQEALSFMRDYRDDPDALRADIEEIKAGDNAKLKAAIPSMERALGVLDGGEEPTVPNGMTRLYHGSAEHGRYDGKAWFSTSKRYAQNYRENAELQYVDIPTTQWDELSDRDIQAGIVGRDSIELDASVTGPRKPIITQPSNGSKMVEADKQLTDYFTQANHLRTQFVGTSTSIDPSRYSPRNFMRVEDEEASGAGAPRFSRRSPHDIRREYLHMLDPLKAGEVEARTFNAVDGLRVYGDRLGSSVATSVFQMELKNTELGKHGVAGQVPSELRGQLADTNILSAKELEDLGGIPKNWVELPGTGKTIISDGKQVHVGFQVPPRVAEAMKPILEKDVLSGAKYWKTAKLTQAYIKAVELGLSPFHMRALTLSFMNNAGIDAYRNAMLSDNNSPEFEAQERNGALYGLTTTKTSTPYEAYRGLKPSSLESRDTLLSKIKEGYEPVDKIFKGITTATFDVVQRKFKVIDFSTREAQWLAKNPDSTDAQYGIAMRSIAKEVNAVYGGLNWDVMGVSANIQAVARMFILAPDWTFSNIANLKYATEGGPGGNAARAFWLKSFVTGYAMTQAMSLLVTGQTSKHFDKVYLGKDSKGKEMYTSMFFAGAPKDAIGLVNSVMRDGFPTGAIEFAVNKSAPLLGTGVRLIENKDWQGKPITKKTDSTATKSGKEAAFTAEQLTPAPFMVKDIINRYMNPDESLTYKDFLGALAGSPVYHEKPTKAKATVRKSVLKHKGSR